MTIVPALKNDDVVSQLCNISRPTGGVEMEKEYNMYKELLSLLDQYEADIYSDWCNGLEHACLINLNEPLISRNASSGLVSVNFNPKVIPVMPLQTRKHS